MLRSLLFVSLFALLASCTNQLPESISEAQTPAPVIEQEVYHPQYDRTALQQIKWLAGNWKGKDDGRDLKQMFLFHTDNMLEVIPTEGSNQKASQFFSWKDGHYYYGQNRQWILSWISEKNIRFDPQVPGLKPMTWSRVNENKWHLIRHENTGDEIIVMERTDEITS